jgi:hypothetical protein
MFSSGPTYWYHSTTHTLTREQGARILLIGLIHTDRSRHVLIQHNGTFSPLVFRLVYHPRGRFTFPSLTHSDLHHTWTSWEYLRMFLLDVGFSPNCQRRRETRTASPHTLQGLLRLFLPTVECIQSLENLESRLPDHGNVGTQITAI